jgi:ATP-dependent RNA helicase DDX47/RRP3
MFAVVLAPTRELCVQIADTFEALGADIALSTVVLMGGMDMATQTLALSKKPHVIVASPGRLVDHLTSTKGFHISGIKFLVMDEADRLLSMDFGTAIDQILEAAPADRQTFLFSATMTSKVSKLQRASLRKPVKVEINSKYDTVSTLIQNYMLVPFKFKQTYLTAVLHHLSSYSGIIFVDTCLNAQKMATMLKHLGFEAICLHGQMNQTQRLHSLNAFKSGAKSLLVATDVAARGLDIPQVDIVVNFDIPKNSKDYVHRVGRTARAGRSGRSITLVTQYDIEEFKKIETLINQTMEEYSEVTEDQAMVYHEKVLEGLRSAHIEIKQKELQVKESTTGKKRNLLLKKKRGQMMARH